MKHKITIESLKNFQLNRLERMKAVLLIELEGSCTNKQFLEYCNRYDCIVEELERRKHNSLFKILEEGKL